MPKLDFNVIENAKTENENSPHRQEKNIRYKSDQIFADHQPIGIRDRFCSEETLEATPILERLKGYNCITEHVYNSTTKRMNKVITCNYNG